MKSACLIVGLLFAAACDDNSDSSDSPGTGSGSDRPAAGTFAAFVVDLIEQRTDAISAPSSFQTFALLPDPDAAANNTHVFDSLF